MDQIQLQQKIAEYYSKLPSDVQSVFKSMKWMEDLRITSIKYELNEDQKEILSTETMLLLLGIVHPDEYEKTLTRDLKMDEIAKGKMIAEINDLIIKTVRPQLITIFNKYTESAVSEKIEKANFEQNIGFVVSGGDYTRFAEKTETTNAPQEVKRVLPIYPFA